MVGQIGLFLYVLIIVLPGRGYKLTKMYTFITWITKSGLIVHIIMIIITINMIMITIKIICNDGKNDYNNNT